MFSLNPNNKSVIRSQFLLCYDFMRLTFADLRLSQKNTGHLTVHYDFDQTLKGGVSNITGVNKHIVNIVPPHLRK